MMTYAILLKPTENHVEVGAIKFPEGGDKLDFFYKYVDCELVDIVHACGLEDLGIEGYDLVVDDEGLLTGKMVNPPASFLYGYLTHGQSIVGNALVCRRAKTQEGVDSVGMSSEEAAQVLAGMETLMAIHRASIGGDIEE